MSDKVFGVGRSVQVVEFCQYVKDKKEAEERAWAAERERCRMLDLADQKYYAELEARSRAALEKHLRDVGSSQSGALAGEVLK